MLSITSVSFPNVEAGKKFEVNPEAEAFTGHANSVQGVPGRDVDVSDESCLYGPSGAVYPVNNVTEDWYLAKQEEALFDGSTAFKAHSSFFADVRNKGDEYASSLSDFDSCFIYLDGSMYRGETVIKSGCHIRHGYGQFTDAQNGTIYEGNFRDGVMDGEGIYFMANGDVYQGTFKRGYMCGQGVYTAALCTFPALGNSNSSTSLFSHEVRSQLLFTNPQKETLMRLSVEMLSKVMQGWCYEGRFANNTCDGIGFVHFSCDDVRIDGTWCAGELQSSSVKILFADSSVYEGPLVDLQPSGMGCLHYANGSVYTGQFKHGKQNGKGRYTDVTSTTCVGMFVDDELHGHAVIEYPNGMTYDGDVEHGVPSGFGKVYWREGYTPMLTEREEGKEGDSPVASSEEKKTTINYPTLDLGAMRREFRHTNSDHAGPARDGDVIVLYYEGEFRNGKSHGKGHSRELIKYLDENTGSVEIIEDTYDGEWYYGVKSGQGKLSRSDGSVFTGVFKGNCPATGTWVYPTPSCTKCYNDSRLQGKGFASIGSDTARGVNTVQTQAGKMLGGNEEEEEQEVIEAEDEEDVLLRCLPDNPEDPIDFDAHISFYGSKSSTPVLAGHVNEMAYNANSLSSNPLGNWTSEGYTLSLEAPLCTPGPSSAFYDLFADYLHEGRQEKEDGSVYVGQLLDIPGPDQAALPHGSGTLSHTDGSVYRGTFMMGKLHGEGSCENYSCSHLHPPFFHVSSSRLVNPRYSYRGEWSNGVPHGFGTLTEFPEENIVYAGHFANGYQHGHGKIFNPFDQCCYEGVFINNLWGGFGTRTLPDGTRRRHKGPILTTTPASPSTELVKEELHDLNILTDILHRSANPT